MRGASNPRCNKDQELCSLRNFDMYERMNIGIWQLTVLMQLIYCAANF
jgi:hypothetical protein